MFIVLVIGLIINYGANNYMKTANADSGGLITTITNILVNALSEGGDGVPTAHTNEITMAFIGFNAGIVSVALADITDAIDVDLIRAGFFGTITKTQKNGATIASTLRVSLSVALASNSDALTAAGNQDVVITLSNAAGRWVSGTFSSILTSATSTLTAAIADVSTDISNVLTSVRAAITGLGFDPDNSAIDLDAFVNKTISDNPNPAFVHSNVVISNPNSSSDLAWIRL